MRKGILKTRRLNVDALIAAIEENRIQMLKAWEKAESLEASIDASESTLKEIRARHRLRKS